MWGRSGQQRQSIPGKDGRPARAKGLSLRSSEVPKLSTAAVCVCVCVCVSTHSGRFATTIPPKSRGVSKGAEVAPAISLITHKPWPRADHTTAFAGCAQALETQTH